MILPGASLEQGTTCWIQNHWIGKEGGLLPTSNYSQASPLEEEGFFFPRWGFQHKQGFPGAWSTGCCSRGASREVLQENVPLGRDLSLAASLLPVMGGFGGGWQGAAGRRAGGGRGQGDCPPAAGSKNPDKTQQSHPGTRPYRQIAKHVKTPSKKSAFCCRCRWISCCRYLTTGKQRLRPLVQSWASKRWHFAFCAQSATLGR